MGKLNVECLSGGLSPPGASAKTGRASLRLTLGTEVSPVWPHTEHTAALSEVGGASAEAGALLVSARLSDRGFGSRS